MASARRLRARYRSSEYAQEYADYLKRVSRLKDDELLDLRLMPDPDKVSIRAYATQSTHKSLTSLRQGSMIHVNDQDFKGGVEEAFHEAYMPPTSTSPGTSRPAARTRSPRRNAPATGSLVATTRAPPSSPTRGRGGC